MTAVLMALVFWFAFKPSGPELNIEATVILFIAGISGVCTTKIMGLINKNTNAILRAVADINRK